MTQPSAENAALAASLIAMTKVLGEVGEERYRQEVKWGQQNHPNGTGLYVLEDLTAADRHRYAVGVERWAKQRTDDAARDGSITYEHILTEEWAEAVAEHDPVALRAELIQVAAVACAWVEKIDRDLANACPTCGPTRTEAHPHRAGVTRCANCKEWLSKPPGVAE